MPRQAPTGIPSLTVTPYGSMGSPRDDTPYTFISPLDLSSIQPSIDLGPMDLDYLDLVEAARDAIAAENILTPEQQLQLAQEKAAKNYAKLVLSKPTTAADIADVQQAKQDLVDLGVTRRQLEAEGIDTGAGISGVMGPTFSGAVGRGIDIASEQFGLLGEGLAGLVGADEALSAVLATVPTPGATFVFGEGGTQRPFITGQTPSGTQVGITDPYGISNILGTIQEGGGFDLSDVVGGIAGVYGPTALATDDEDDNEEVKTGADVVKVGDTTDDTTQTIRTDDITGDTTQTIRTDDITGDTTQTIRTDDITGDTSVFDDIYDDVRVEDILLDERTDSTPDTRTETTDTRTETSDTPSGGGGGGGGFGTPAGGVETIKVEPGPLVDIPGFYDISSMSIIPDYIDELVARGQRRQTRGAAEGGHVKRFNNGDLVQTGSDGFTLDPNSVLAGGTGTGGGDSNVRRTLSQFVGDNAGALLASAVGGLFGLLDSGEQQPAGYQGGIPDYTARRSLLPGAFDQTGRRPGSMGRRYFTDVQYVPTGEGAVMQGVGLPAVAPEADTSTELNTEALAGLTAALAGTTPAGTTPAGTTPAGTTPVGTTPAGTTPVGTTPAGTTPAGTTPTGTTLTPTAQTATDFLLDLGYGQAMTGQEAANKLASDLNTMAESEFGIDTLLDTLGIDTAEEKANVAKLTPNPIMKLDIAGGESNVLPEGIGGMDVLSPAEAALQQDLISKQATSLAQAGGDPFQQAIYSSLSSDTAGLQDSLPYYAGVVGDVLRSGGDTLGGAAEKFDLTVPEAAEELMLTGAMTPDEVAGLVNTTGLTKNGQSATTGDPALDMMISLIEGGTTTLEEAATIYGIPADQAEAVYEDVIKNRLQPIQAAAQGGMMQGRGYYLGGPTDGMADQIPATINNIEPARLSDGEFVIPADVVSHLGNGNSDAGAQQLYSMMDRVRKERTGTTKQGPMINPTRMMPA